MFYQRFVWFSCVPPHIGCRIGSGMWRSLWCCMLEGDLSRSDLNGYRRCGLLVLITHHQLIWGGLEVLVDSYCSSWSHSWCVFVLLCLQQMQECSSSAQMNHRVEVWFLFVVLIDWIMKLRILANLKLVICIWIMNFISIQFIWSVQYNLVLGSSESICGFPEIELNKV